MDRKSEEFKGIKLPDRQLLFYSTYPHGELTCKPANITGIHFPVIDNCYCIDVYCNKAKSNAKLYYDFLKQFLLYYSLFLYYYYYNDFVFTDIFSVIML